MPGSDQFYNLSGCDCHVYLIEDDPHLRLDLSKTIEDEGLVVHAYASAEEFLESSTACAPAVIVSDMVLSGLSGLKLLTDLRKTGNSTPFVFVSGYSEPQQIIDAMKLGVVDFLWKPFKTDLLFEAIRKGLAEDIRRMNDSVGSADLETRWQSLSEREVEVCRLMLKGYGIKDIATRLNVQYDTANKHRIRVMKKMGAAQRPQLIELLKGFGPAEE